jgi:fused signal recognition particle receptor
MTRWFSKLSDNFTSLLKGKKATEEVLQELEDALICADVGVSLSSEFMEKIKAKRFVDDDEDAVRNYLGDLMTEQLVIREKELSFSHKPTVLLMIGVNASGKTTSVGKLAYQLAKEGKKVRLVAADTFRAGAVDQLKVWAERANVPIEFAEKKDPNTVIFEACRKSYEEEDDVLIIDTAGRLHNKVALMDELSKTVRTIQKVDPSAPHETILVIDGNTGQNALSQITLFNSSAPVSGLIVTKLDGSAKAGVVLQITKNYEIPIYYLGVGEAIEDLQPFDAKLFVANILDLDYE